MCYFKFLKIRDSRGVALLESFFNMEKYFTVFE